MDKDINGLTDIMNAKITMRKKAFDTIITLAIRTLFVKRVTSVIRFLVTSVLFTLE